MEECGTLVVLRAETITGILTDRDLAIAIADVHDPARASVATVMTRRVHICRLDDEVWVAVDTMARFKVRRLPVVSDSGDVEGLIAIDDIILWAIPQSAVSLPVLRTALRSIRPAVHRWFTTLRSADPPSPGLRRASCQGDWLHCPL